MKIKNPTLRSIVLMSLVMRALASTPDTFWISWLIQTNTNVVRRTLRKGWPGMSTKIPLVSCASQMWYWAINNWKTNQSINNISNCVRRRERHSHSVVDVTCLITCISGLPKGRGEGAETEGSPGNEVSYMWKSVVKTRITCVSRGKVLQDLLCHVYEGDYFAVRRGAK